MWNKIRRYCRFVWYWMIINFYEKPRGLDFHMKDQAIAHVPGSKNFGYVVTSKSCLNKIFGSINITQKNNFIDMGCGKGFVLTEAAKQPYNKVFGFDILPELIQIASKNISILGLTDRVSVQIHDAVLFDCYDEFDHFFMYNPFPAEVMKCVITNILKSLDHCPRDIIIIYSNPTQHSLFLDTGRFEVIQTVTCFLQVQGVYIYRSK